MLPISRISHQARHHSLFADLPAKIATA